MPNRASILITLGLMLCLGFGCAENDDNDDPGIPWSPSPEKLTAGPDSGCVFLHWNDLGRSRSDSSGGDADGWCYPGVAAHIEIPRMIGLGVPGTAITQDSVHCTLEIADPDYAQFEYYPDGLTFSDSVTMWIDTSVVQIPQGLSADSVTFYYYSRSSGHFYAIPTFFDTVTARWKAKTIHFSRYIIGQKASRHAQ